MLTAAKQGKFSAPMAWTDECVLPLAASGVYPKTRVWGSEPENVHCSSATTPLRIELRWGCEECSEKTAVGSGVTFKYNPMGYRIYKSSSVSTSVYAYDGDSVVEETNGAGTVVARYSQGQDEDEPLAMLRSSATSYYDADGLGSITSLSNTAGSLAQTYGYDSFGKQTTSSGSLTNSFQYTAREFDSESSLYYYRARYYDPMTGRFLSEDPLEFGGGRNFYAYSRNDPIALVDPSGMIPEPANTIAPAMPGDTAGFFIANLNDPRLSDIAHAPWPQARTYFGESHECVAFTKTFTGLPCSDCWRAGPKVIGNNIPEGTAIATFDNSGRYPNNPHGNNSGLFLGTGSPTDPPNTLIMIDQWPGHHAQARAVTPNGPDASNQSGAYSVITVPNGTKSAKCKCGNW
jgi:RHS repeat-associated protein